MQQWLDSVFLDRTEEIADQHILIRHLQWGRRVGGIPFVTPGAADLPERLPALAAGHHGVGGGRREELLDQGRLHMFSMFGGRQPDRAGPYSLCTERITLSDDQVDAGVESSRYVAGTSDKCGGELAQLVGFVDGGPGRADPTREEVDVGFEHRLELFLLNLARPDEAGPHARTTRVRDVVLFLDRLNEPPVFVGDMGFDRLAAVVFGHAWRKHKVDPEGAVTHEASDLSELIADLVGKAAGRAINAQTAGQAYRGDGGDVVGEAEDRLLDAELFADGGVERGHGPDRATSRPRRPSRKRSTRASKLASWSPRPSASAA